MNKHTTHEKTLIIGVGNPILSDDGAGILVARRIQEIYSASTSIHVVEASLGGIGLLDLMAGYDKVIIVDSIKTESGEPGTCYRFTVDDLGNPSYSWGPHFLDLRTAVELGTQLGFNIPESITIYAIEIKENELFSEMLSPEVEDAIPCLVKKIIDDLKQ
jgi:hydrogenase maturation protease